MEKRNKSLYDSDKDTARVRRHAERSTYLLSVAYLIFMFFMTRVMKFPLAASLCYPGVLVIGSVLFFCKQLLVCFFISSIMRAVLPVLENFYHSAAYIHNHSLPYSNVQK